MKFAKITKRITASLISLSMILSMVTVYAAPPKGNPADHTAETQKADLIYTFLGTSPASDDKATRPAKAFTGELSNLNSEFAWEENGLVWVGIKMKNATRLRDVFNSGSTDTNDDAGMNDFVLSLAYDTDYFGLPQNSNNDGATQSQRLLQNGYPKTESGGDIYTFSNESTGLDYAAMLGGASAQTVEPLHLTQTDNSKVAIYRAKLRPAETGVANTDCLLFQDGASIYGGWNDDYTVASPVKDDEITLFVIPLRMVGAEPPAAGTKAIEGYFDMAGTTITVGHGSEGITYEYSQTPTEIGSNGDTNIKNYFNITSLINLFPDQYTIEFYGTKTGDTYSDKLDNDLSIKEGESVSTTDGAEMPADTAFDAYTPTGELFDVLKYLDQDGNEKEFKDTTNITADMVGEDKTLKVYATYEAGNTITFKANYPADATITADDKAVVISKDAGTTIPTDKQPTVSNDAGADFAIPDGYTFDGWYDAAGDGANKVDLATATFTGNTDLYAHWKQQINITFHKNANESPEETTVVAIAPGDSIPSEKMPADPTRADDYDFAGWNTMSNGAGDPVTAGTKTFDAAADVYAIWTATGTDQVTLHFDPVLDGVTANPADVTVNKGDAIHVANIPVVAKDDYKFDGWFKTAAVTATDVVDFDNNGNGYVMPNDKTEETVYAHWTYQGTDAVDVTFKKEKADSTDYEDYIVVPVKPGTSLGASMPANPTKDGKTFTGWNTAQDGSGTAFTGDTTVSAATTVYAQYVDDISITYNANTGTLTGDLATNPTVTKPAGDDYADPAAPTKDGYTFIGWNTKQSGGGEYIEAGANAGGTGNITYGDVGAQLGEDKTLYAQWAAVKDPDKDDVKDDNPVNPDPDKQGAVVNFNENVSASTTDPITSAVSPSHKYPKLGETLASMGGLPEAPSRGANYTFLGWNTQPDGSGVPFDENTTVDTATLGDALTIAADGTGSVTVYAQWKLADDYTGDKIKLTFSKNTDGTGSDKYKEIELVKGDALGYVPTVSNGDFEFNGWFGGTVTDGKVVFDESDEFDADAAIDANTTYYAKWQQYIVIVPTSVRKKDETGTGTPIADGIVYANKEYTILYNVYTATLSEDSEEGFVLGDLVKDESNNDLTNIDLTAADSPIPVTYSNATDSSTTLKTAGTYTISADAAGSYLEAQGYELLQSYPESVEITPALVTVKVDPDTQIRKSSDTNKAIGITYEGFFADEAADKGEATATVNYRKWTPADTTDTTIETTELDVATTVVPADVAKYVVEVKIGDTNYKVGNVVSSTDGTNPILYPREADATYPGYGAVYTEEEGVFTLTKPGENIYYEIQVSDPSIKTVKVTSEKTGETPEELGLKTPDFTADQTFETGEDPTVKDYGVRVTDTEAETVKIEVELTNPDTTTITATVKKPGANEGDDPIDSPLTITPAKDNEGNDIPGKYIVEVPLDNKGKDTNDVTITTKAGTDENAPSIDYTFKIQQLVEARVEFEPGNSPYGLIERMSQKYIDIENEKIDQENAANQGVEGYTPKTNLTAWDEATIAQAKEAFDQSDEVNKQYGTDLVPYRGKGNLTYTTVAWNSYAHTNEDENGDVITGEDGNPVMFNENYDMDPTALFVYQSEEFKIPEFKAYDDLGNEITDVTTTLKIGEQSFEGVSRYTRTSSDNVTMIDAPLVEGTTDTYTISGKVIRNDVYFVEYEYTYTDVNGTSHTQIEKRPVIILSRLGDLYLSKIVSVNTNDVNYFRRNTGAVYLGNSLVAYRSMDLVTSPIPSINTSDVNYFRRNSGAVYLSTDQYYTSLN